MFDTKDFNRIDKGYFEVLSLTSLNIKVRSKNTGHLWSIHSKDLNQNISSIEIWHQHKDEDRPHLQRGLHPLTVREAQKMIKEHDRYVLNGREPS